MKKQFNYIILFSILLSSLFSISSLRSLVLPGWGEKNEFNILAKDTKLENIQYIKNRSNTTMLAEGIFWIGFLISNELSDSYENDFKVYAQTNAGVDWSSIPNSQFSKYAANVGNEMNFNDYNELRSQVGLSTYPEGIGYEWDWNDNNSNRLRYDKLRNKSGQLSKLNNYIAASLLINRLVSAFYVLNIKKKHGRMFSFDVEDNNYNYKFNFNYHF